MDLIEDALQPLIDRGVVIDVEETDPISESTVSGIQPLPVYAVIVNSPDPQGFREEVMRLLYGAGLTSSVGFVLRSKGSASRAWGRAPFA